MILAGHGAYGDFSGTLTYSFADPTHAELRVELINTSPASNGGYLTAFVFNNPGDKISGVTLAATDPDFKLLGAPPFHNVIKSTPYGWFDLGAAVGKGGFLGGGDPKPGMAVGATETFTFSFTGQDLNTLDESSFSNELSANPQGGGAKSFEARFRGFKNNGSDKVSGLFTGSPPPVPVPSTLLLLGSGLVGLGVMGWRRRKS